MLVHRHEFPYTYNKHFGFIIIIFCFNNIHYNIKILEIKLKYVNLNIENKKV